jgi:hypothetical protein
MPDGSCCSEANFCQVGNDKYCCSEGQTCDIVKGCVDAKDNIETLCANGGGTIISASSGTFCRRKNGMTWYEAEEWCQKYGMTMPTMYEMCPSWDGNTGEGKCSWLKGKFSGYVWSATVYGSGDAFYVDMGNDVLRYGGRANGLGGVYGDFYAFCR